MSELCRIRRCKHTALSATGTVYCEALKGYVGPDRGPDNCGKYKENPKRVRK